MRLRRDEMTLDDAPLVITNARALAENTALQWLEARVRRDVERRMRALRPETHDDRAYLDELAYLRGMLDVFDLPQKLWDNAEKLVNAGKMAKAEGVLG